MTTTATAEGEAFRFCDCWRNSFEAFVEDMGERPEGMTFDRIDVDVSYEPGNCRSQLVVRMQRRQLHPRA